MIKEPLKVLQELVNIGSNDTFKRFLDDRVEDHNKF